MSDTLTTVRFRPRPALIRTAAITFAVAAVPIFGTLYWFAVRTGAWPQVLVANIALVGIGFAVIWRQLLVFTEVTPTHIRGNGILTRTLEVELDDIGSIELVDVYAAHSPETQRQLVVLDPAGECRFRLRGHYWGSSTLRRIADATGASVHERGEALSQAEFYRAYPRSAYWFENRPLVRVALAVTAALALVGIAAWVLSVVGLPLALPL